MARLARNATALGAAIFIPPGLFVLAFADGVLGLFGPDFVSGANTLRALLAGQLVIAVFGISGQVLVMTNHARYNLFPNLAATALVIFRCPLRSPRSWRIGCGNAASRA
jgi:O-antigen/teichoic acid export membrane protein